MTQRKAPSPLSAPIARVRATGATVRYGEAHNPTYGYPHGVCEVVVVEPGLCPLRITRPSFRYGELVDRLSRIADRREQVASHAPTDGDYPETCTDCGEPVDSDGIDSNGSSFCDDAERHFHTTD